MKIAMLTNEYPPHVYGGAGVHVEYLTREISKISPGDYEIQVVCFGDQREKLPGLSVTGVSPKCDIVFDGEYLQKLGEVLLKNMAMSSVLTEADLIHCHTWYSHLAGCLLKQLLDAPLVLTTHSLEPHRPWKAQQLGSAYNVSSWMERTAYQNCDGVIAVSSSMKEDVHNLYDVPEENIRVIHNGIDLQHYEHSADRSTFARFGIDPARPFILFVGRITRQKGIAHLLDAAAYLPPEVQIVLCAGSPDTEDIRREIQTKIDDGRRLRPGTIIWIPQFLPRDELISLYSLADLFVCPSIYEPFGIINLEAMACRTPVVASAVGGIPEVVISGETGLLVPVEMVSEGVSEVRDPNRFARDLADAINRLLSSEAERRGMGVRGRARVEEHFSWRSIARKTVKYYEELTAQNQIRPSR